MNSPEIPPSPDQMFRLRVEYPNCPLRNTPYVGIPISVGEIPIQQISLELVHEEIHREHNIPMCDIDITVTLVESD